MIFKLLLVLIIPLLTTTGQICLKKGVQSWGTLELTFSNILSLIPRIFQSGWLITGIFVFGIDFLLYFFILSKFNLSILYPVMVSAGIIAISLASWLLLKESLSAIQILGIVVIIFGIFLLVPKN